MNGATIKRVIKDVAILIKVNPTNFSMILETPFLNDGFLGTDFIAIDIVIGSRNTIELIFTPTAKPKNTEVNIRNIVLFCLRNFIMKSKDTNRKKVKADSGVAK